MDSTKSLTCSQLVHNVLVFFRVRNLGEPKFMNLVHRRGCRAGGAVRLLVVTRLQGEPGKGR